MLTFNKYLFAGNTSTKLFFIVYFLSRADADVGANDYGVRRWCQRN